MRQVPERSVEQRRQALALANRRRFAQAAMLKLIREAAFRQGCEIVAQVLDGPDEDQARIPAARLLLAVHRFGEARLDKLMREAGVLSSQRRVGMLTDRQRTVLAAGIRRMAKAYQPSRAAA
jgi:hypothetical protein